jgi:hypothetical protein
MPEFILYMMNYTKLQKDAYILKHKKNNDLIKMILIICNEHTV